MLRVESIKAQNFMSFESFELNVESGVHFVEGINYDVGGSNGAGKSALFEALVWVLYGRSIRSRYAQDVVREGTDSTMVEVVLSDSRNRYVITREYSKRKKSLTLNGCPVSDEDLEKWIGMDFEQFTNVVVFGQGIIKTFVTLPDSEKKAVLMKLLRIEKFKKAAEICRKVVKECEMKLGELSVLITHEEQTVKELLFQLAKTERVLEQYEKQLSDLESKKQLLLGTELDKDVENELKSVVQELEDKKQCHSEAAKKCAVLAQQIIAVQTSIEELHNHIIQIKNMTGRCPVCLRAVTGKEKEHTLKLLQAQVDEKMKELSELQSKLAQSREMCDELNRHIAELGNLKRQLESDLEQYLAARAELFSIDSKMSILESSIASMREQRNALLSTAESHKRNLDQYKQQVEELRHRQLIYDFWAEGFGGEGMINLVIEPAVKFLEDRANYYLSKMTDKCTVEMSVQSELRSGEKRDKISLIIHNETGADDYLLCSGGEKKRVELAVVLALRDLIRWAGVERSFDLFVADEIFDSVDEVGSSRICSILSEFGGSVYVISHNEELKKYFTKFVTVQKMNGVSMLVR